MKEREREIGWMIKEKYGGSQPPELELDIKRLDDGEPVAYIIGFTDFLNCRIDLSAHPLIPRVETEYWVKQAIDELPKGKDLSCLDIFSGSGCIGVAILKNLSQTKMVFAEKELKLLEQIKKNLELNGILEERYSIVQTDIFKNISEKFDVIFANPPYIPSGRELDKSVADHEPPEALFGGVDGLDIIANFLREAKNYLTPNGQVWLEFDCGQKDSVSSLLAEFGYVNIRFCQDQYGRDRFVVFTN